MGEGISYLGIDPFRKRFKIFLRFLFILNPLLTDGTLMTFCVMKSSAEIFCGAVHNMERWGTIGKQDLM